MAFIMHSLSWLATGGTAAIVCFPGIMYRGGAEQKIRKYLIDNNYVDCVIQLPSNLFFGTTIATCIMVLKKSKPDNRTLFIDATGECIKVTNNNKLTEANIARIVDVFARRAEEAHFSHLADYDEVVENNYNLSVSTYVEQEDKREQIDIVKLNAQIEEIVAREQVLRDEIAKDNRGNRGVSMNQEFEFLMYRAADEDVTVNAVIKDETIWLTQNAMAELFSVDKSSISRHLRNIFSEGELDEKVVVAKIATTTQHGAMEGKTQTRETNFYNLDAIISVGYRVNSKRATHFRIWATGILKEYMTKGFVLDDERLKQGKTVFGKDYFPELLERVRSIRASERRIWQQVTDIFAECSIDYDKNAEITQTFYAMVQNKFHYAITGQTAAEIVYTHADRSKENMGLTTWKHAPEGRILKSDVSIAKNYLNEKQIRQLERTVTGYFDYIEDLIERENTFTMEEFAASINEFLAFRRYDILPDRGRISSREAKAKAETEYDAFNKTQKITSDFDREVKRILEKGGDAE